MAGSVLVRMMDIFMLYLYDLSISQYIYSGHNGVNIDSRVFWGSHITTKGSFQIESYMCLL